MLTDDTTEIVIEASGLRAQATPVPRSGLRPAHWVCSVIETATGKVRRGPLRTLTERAAYRRAHRAWTQAVNS